MYYEDDDLRERRSFIPAGRKAKRDLGSLDPHIPNKFERAALVQLQQKSGQTEEEVRASLTNRRVLAKAAKSDYGTGANKQRLLLRRYRTLTSERTGLHINHPKVKTIAIDVINQLRRSKSSFSRWETADDIIDQCSATNGVQPVKKTV